MERAESGADWKKGSWTDDTPTLRRAMVGGFCRLCVVDGPGGMGFGTPRRAAGYAAAFSLGCLRFDRSAKHDAPSPAACPPVVVEIPAGLACAPSHRLFPAHHQPRHSVCALACLSTKVGKETAACVAGATHHCQVVSAQAGICSSREAEDTQERGSEGPSRRLSRPRGERTGPGGSKKKAACKRATDKTMLAQQNKRIAPSTRCQRTGGNAICT